MEVLIYYSAMLSAEILLHGTDSVAHGPAISARPQTRNSTFLIYLEKYGEESRYSVKFSKYPMFVQVFLDKQVGDMYTHDEIFVTPSHTKKFKKKWVKVQLILLIPITHPLLLNHQKKQKPRKPKRKDTKIPQSSGPKKPIADEAANEENVHTHSNDPMLSGEDSLKLNNLMEIYQIATEVLDLENTKTTQAQEISNEGLGDQEDPSKQGRKIDDIDQDAEVTLVDETHGRHDDPQMFDRDVFNGEEVFVAEQSEKSYEKYLILALQAEEEEQARLEKEKAKKVKEANISWDNVQAMIEAVRLLAKRLQAREQEEVTDEEKARLFIELLKKRKKHFAALRAQEKRNKPPTKSQKKSTMPTYLKHMAGYKQSQLKKKSFVEIQKLFDKSMTRVNMFVDMDTKLVKESSKKVEAEMAQETSSKRAGEELEQEIHRKGRNGYYEIMRADGSSKIYLLFSQLIKSFGREDLETLWKLVKAKHGSTRPEEGL
ncbi:hypothetical protein Tco_0857665 [Tanacetum coccineum]|uniref:Uncharacterized protein n=1 Tax=Tanacetum coccineum TaxID=301880 RepID=A0ABQ5BAV2_9ASTR